MVLRLPRGLSHPPANHTQTFDRQRKLISKINAALQRIEDNTYGYCDETGEPISLKRLEGQPVFACKAIHKPGALYEAFAPAEARRILRRLEFHFTPSGVTLAPLRLGALYCAIGHTLRAMICSQTGNDAIKVTARIFTSLMSKLGRY